MVRAVRVLKDRSAHAPQPAIEFASARGELMPLVESYYLYRWDAPEFSGVERVDLGQIRFLLRGDAAITFPDGHTDAVMPVTVSGPGTGAASYVAQGPFHCFGISLRAIGWKSVIGLPAHAVSDRLLDGVALLGPETSLILSRLRHLATLEEMVAAVEPFLLARHRPVPASHRALAQAVREWAAAGTDGVDALYARLDMSKRQATRLCNEYFGGPPKHLERKFRAIRAAMKIHQGGSNADAAAPFYDDPHMIREIKQFTGHTPTSLRAGIDPVLALTLDKETFRFLPDVTSESVDVRLP